MHGRDELPGDVTAHPCSDCGLHTLVPGQPEGRVLCMDCVQRRMEIRRRFEERLPSARFMSDEDLMLLEQIALEVEAEERADPEGLLLDLPPEDEDED